MSQDYLESNELGDEAYFAEEPSRANALFASDNVSVSKSASFIPETSGSQRLHIYNGNLTLGVQDVEATRILIETMVDGADGYVENSYSDFLTLRIPAEQFAEFFAALQVLGELRSHHVQTWDVTDSYSDLELRLSTTQAALARLEDLLDRSTDAQERARILKEIGRLREEIQGMERQISHLESRITYSQITVHLQSLLQSPEGTSTIPFPWIAEFDPLMPAGNRLRGSFNGNLGPEYAVLPSQDVFWAEDSEGRRVMMSTLENRPQGDDEFWQRALLYNLGDFYPQVEAIDVSIGDTVFRGVFLTSGDATPYRNLVAIHVDRDKLHVLEVFTPSGEDDLDALLTALSEGKFQ